MDGDGEQTDHPLGGGTVAWHAAIGNYRITCSLVERSAEVLVLSVAEKGETLQVQELAARASATDVHDAALRLREQYIPRILNAAKRQWRLGGIACLTTSWSSAPQVTTEPPAVE